MRTLIVMLLLPLLSSLCVGQSTRDQKFETTVRLVIDAFARQDSASVSKHINKEIGLYQLDRIGVFDHFNHFKMISFPSKGYPQVLFGQSKGITILPLTYAGLPTWNCDKDTWSKKGLFVDTTKVDHLLSKICKDRNKHVPDNIPAKRIQFFYELENKSRRIVLYDRNKKELIFYLSYLNDTWYLTIVDYVSSDCSV